MTLFTDVLEDPVFADRTVLEKNYYPDKLSEREDEIETLVSTLKELFRGSVPHQVFLTGGHGVGKTATMGLVTSDIRETAEEKGHDILVLEIHCDSDDANDYSLLLKMVNGLRGKLLSEGILDEDSLDNEQFKSGTNRMTLVKAFEADVSEYDGKILFAIDEFDALEPKGQEEILSHFIRQRGFSGNKLAFMCTMNVRNPKSNYTEQTLSPLSERIIKFDPYVHGELVSLLERRAEKAFIDGFVTDAAIKLCAALAAQRGGDARLAIELLLKSGDIAESKNVDQLSESHVRAAEEEKFRNFVEEQIDELSKSKRVTLLSMILAEEQQDSRPTTREIREVYPQVCEHQPDFEPRTSRTVRDHLRQFAESMDLVDRLHISNGNGHSYELPQEIEWYVTAVASDNTVALPPELAEYA